MWVQPCRTTYEPQDKSQYLDNSATAGKQPLTDPNGELSAKVPYLGISPANACVGKLLDGDGPRLASVLCYHSSSLRTL